MSNCKKCGNEFEPSKGLVSYCSLKCRNSRSHSDDVKQKISKSVSKTRTLIPRYDNKSYERHIEHVSLYKQHPKLCKICGTALEYNKRYNKTCSKICSITASTNRSYQNGSRKTFIYNGIILESSWELEIAILLDSKNIKWIRPEPIPWKQYDGKQRMYYPDFYLVDYSVYLDPKNPYCMDLDKEKMKIISEQIDIIYGDINLIKEYIESVV